jgi:hypothetical protein
VRAEGSGLREEKESIANKESAEKAVRDIRRRTRRRFSAERLARREGFEPPTPRFEERKKRQK